MNVTVRASKPIRGTFNVPGDKSISHRALMIGAISEGTTVIEGLSSAVDVVSTLECLRNLAVAIESSGERILVHGRGLFGLRKAEQALDAGNSGTTIRLLAGILCAQKFDSTISGDESLNKRPMKRIIDPLTSMGAVIEPTADYTAPLHIIGGRTLEGIRYDMVVPSAQVKSAILLAGLHANGTTAVSESIKTRDHTERMLGLTSTHIAGKYSAVVQGGRRLEPQQFIIPGDISSAAFLIVAALIVPGSEIVIRGVGLNPTRTAFVDVLTRLGGSVETLNERVVAGEPVGDVRVKSSELRGEITIAGDSVPALIDEIPILVVAGLFCEGPVQVRDARELRVKESDRIRAIVSNLRALSVEVEEYEDGFAFENKKELIGATVQSFGDHRIAMAFAVAALRAQGDTIVEGADSVAISYPEFWNQITQFQS